MFNERQNKSSDRIREGRRTMLEIEKLGVSILQDLHQQRQSLLHAHGTLHGSGRQHSRSKKILTNMSTRMSGNKWSIGFIMAVLAVAISLILYLKLFQIAKMFLLGWLCDCCCASHSSFSFYVPFCKFSSVF